jgi:NDP-sugar pyrophosphorylase family protein
MRQILMPPLAALSLLALPASAQGAEANAPRKKSDIHCSIDLKQGDRFAKGRNLVIERDTKVRDAVVVDGDVVIRAGTTVEDVVAIRGHVRVEDGAWVTGNLMALGGDIRLGKGVKVEGNVTALGGRLELDPSATITGSRTQFSLNLNGEELVRGFLDKALVETETRCEPRVNEN